MSERDEISELIYVDYLCKGRKGQMYTRHFFARLTQLYIYFIVRMCSLVIFLFQHIFISSFVHIHTQAAPSSSLLYFCARVLLLSHEIFIFLLVFDTNRSRVRNQSKRQGGRRNIDKLMQESDCGYDFYFIRRRYLHLRTFSSRVWPPRRRRNLLFFTLLTFLALYLSEKHRSIFQRSRSTVESPRWNY